MGSSRRGNGPEPARAAVCRGPGASVNSRPAMPAPVALLLGPTATGKSALAIAVARELDAEVVSVDSALVYRGLDIGTAKPTAAERAGVPHHLIDIREPDRPYSAGEFRADALRCIEAIHARGRLPLLVGGTLLYFRALEHGIANLPVADPDVRARIAHEAETLGWPALHARLLALDPAAGARIGVADRQRIARALEVHALTGAALTVAHASPGPSLAERYRVLRIVLAPPDRAALHRAIEARVDGMFRAGLVHETAGLRARGLDDALPALRAVGYRQVLATLREGADPQGARHAVLAATRALARRQLTWLRGEPAGVWMSPYHHDTPARALGLLRQACAWL